MAFLCFSQQGEFKNIIKNFLEKYTPKTFYKQVEEKTILSFFSFDFLLSRFWPFLCMKSSKTPQQHLQK
jgi:hypothetical protein